ncbi:MAG: hypothetical protein V4481_05520 [Patescibacteria group bacterium]
MGYNKLIKYADIIETYTYERPLPIRPRAKRGVSHRASVPRMASDRNDPLRQEQYEGKRKDNATRASMVFRRLVSANLGGTDHPFLFTCTYKENQTDIAKGYKDFSSFIKALRYKFGKQFRYIAVPEFQKRGAVHFHAMFWGLPDTLAQEERHTRLVGTIWGHGFVDVYHTDGHQKLSTYLTKYMTKTFTDYRLLGQKAYTCSRNLTRPEIVSGISNFGLDSALQESGADKAEVDKTYDTHRLGKGRHRIYKIK